MSVSSAIMDVYSWSMIASFGLAVILFAIWMLVNERKRQGVLGTALMISASTVVVLLVGSRAVNSYVASRHELPEPPKQEYRLSPEARADLAGNRLERARTGQFIRSHYPLFAAVPSIMSIASQAEAEEKARSFFAELPLKNQLRVGVLARRVIFLHSLHEPTEKYFAEYDQAQSVKKHKNDIAQGSSDSPIEGVKQIDDAGQIGFLGQIDGDLQIDDERGIGVNAQPSTNDLALVALLRNLDAPIDPAVLTEKVALVKSELPEGWYRNSILGTLYTNARDSAKTQDLLSAQESLTDFRLHKIFAAAVLRVVICLAGCAVIISFFQPAKSPSKEPDNPVGNTSIKRVYCLFLANFFSLMAVLTAELMIFALVPTLANLRNDWPASIFEAVSELIVTLVCVREIICKPLGLRLKEAFARPAPAGSKVLIVWGAGLFCVLKVSIVLYLLTLRLILHWQVSFSNPAVNMVWATVLHPNFLSIASLWLHIAIVSPICEEIVFRGVLYAVLRKRIGVARACFLSSAIFSVAHLDPGGLVPTFIIGVGLAIVFERTRSLLPCVVTHMLWNSYEILTTWLMA